MTGPARLFPLLGSPDQPAAPAVVTDGHVVGYPRLAGWATQIGGSLADQGVPPGALVGLSATAKARWIALYAMCDLFGWVAVPIDPAAPGPELERLHSVLGLAAVVAWGPDRPAEWTGRRPLVVTVADHPADQLTLDVEPAAGTDTAGRAAAAWADVDQAVIFPTSGSTGGSKQVVLSRGAIINGLDAVGGMWELGPGVRTMSIAPLWLFAGYQYTMPTVRAGGSVVAVERLQPDTLLAAVRTAPIRGVFMVPTHARLLRDRWHTDPEPVPLREILFGGERLEPDLQRWLERTFPGTDITVELGISEAGGQITYLTDADRRQHPESVGRVFTGASVTVLTEHGATARAGTGRLRCVTDRMMTGYFQGLGTRWLDPDGGYRTEDVVRIDDDGLVYHLGRSSAMIRVGGRTINPADIDAVVTSVPGVLDTAAVGINLVTGGQAAVALVVPTEGFDPARLTEALAAGLSPYKRPARVVTVPAIPRNANQKVNIPAARLLATAADQLDLSAVDTGASFIALGGDSISALQVAQRLDLVSASDTNAPAEELLGAGSLTDLTGTDTAALTRSTPAGDEEHRRPAALPAPDDLAEGRWPATSAQERLWYLANAEGPAWSYNAPLWVRLDGPLDRRRLEAAFATLVRDQPILRCNFSDGADRLWMREAEPDRWPALDWATAGSEAEAFELLAATCRRTFDITQPPLVRATVVRIGGDGLHHVLGIAMHHGLTDYASGQVVVSRLRDFYDGVEPAALPAPLHPAAIAALESAYVGSPAGAAARRWWAAYLQPVPPRPPLPEVAPAAQIPAGQSPAAQAPDRQAPAWHRVGVPADLRDAVRRTATELNVTEFSLLAYAFGLALRDSVRQPETVVGIIDARRPVVAAGHTVGCYFNTVPVRVPASLPVDRAGLISRFLPDLRTVLQHARLPLPAILSAWTRKHRTRFHFDAIFQVTQRAPAALADSGRLRLRAVDNAELPWHQLTVPRTPYEVTLCQPDLGGNLMTRSAEAGPDGSPRVWSTFHRVLGTLVG